MRACGSPQLPPVNYATLIDYYVLSSFIFAFGIIIAQTLSMLSIYDETPYVFDVTAWWPTRHDPPIIFSFPPPLIIGGFTWCIVHLVILILYATFYFRRRMVRPEARLVCSRHWGKGGYWVYGEEGKDAADSTLIFKETRPAIGGKAPRLPVPEYATSSSYHT